GGLMPATQTCDTRRSGGGSRRAHSQVIRCRLTQSSCPRVLKRGWHTWRWIVQRVEQHRIDRHDPRWAAIDQAAFASKNLYNAALYRTRQAYLQERRVLPYPTLVTEMTQTHEYRALPAKVAQWTLQQVCAAWRSF